MSEEKESPKQEFIYALDIGTRNVIGLIGTMEGSRIRITAVEKLPHESRAMMDGQIEDIDQVAQTVREITKRLEEKVKQPLTQVCVAAAGRSLRTEKGYSSLELSAPEQIGEERIQQLTAQAVANAEQLLQQTENPDQRMFLVGYTPIQFLLDHYPLTKLQGHTGKILEATVVATFLPGEVIDSLNAVIQKADLSIFSLTLEPIAALNAAIPEDIRLLNLVLADIGAGTTDIAVCRDGSVCGYTMATIAGDELTEAIMREYLTDYPTAERIKTELGVKQVIAFTDILGLEQSVESEEIFTKLEPALENLATEIGEQILQLNDTAPSALFLAGGGSKFHGLCQRVADTLKMDPRRVALAGGHFKVHAYSDVVDLNDPEYATPLGIAISAGLGLIQDSYRIFLNHMPARLFRSGKLTVLDILMMNGYQYGDMLGRNGKNLTLMVDGKREIYYGEPAVPAQLSVNGELAAPSTLVYAGDQIEFIPARNGDDCTMTVGEFAQMRHVAGFSVNGMLVPENQRLTSGDILETVSIHPQVENSAQPSENFESGEIRFILNGEKLKLPSKPDHMPYYLMDLLEYSGLDFEHLEQPVTLKVNGEDAMFQQIIQNGDTVDISLQNW